MLNGNVGLPTCTPFDLHARLPRGEGHVEPSSMSSATFSLAPARSMAWAASSAQAMSSRAEHTFERTCTQVNPAEAPPRRHRPRDGRTCSLGQ